MTIAERVKRVLEDEIGCEPEKITADAAFAEDLGCDSLDAVEIVMALEEEFDLTIPDEVTDGLTTVGKLVAYIEGRVS